MKNHQSADILAIFRCIDGMDGQFSYTRHHLWIRAATKPLQRDNWIRHIGVWTLFGSAIARISWFVSVLVGSVTSHCWYQRGSPDITPDGRDQIFVSLNERDRQPMIGSTVWSSVYLAYRVADYCSINGCYPDLQFGCWKNRSTCKTYSRYQWFCLFGLLVFS